MLDDNCNILILCVGNICRSPMAEYLLRNMAKSNGSKNLSVSSAGLRALVDHPAHAYTHKLLMNKNID
jgi:protein-tyrosine phosphatase